MSLERNVMELWVKEENGNVDAILYPLSVKFHKPLWYLLLNANSSFDVYMASIL